MKRSVAVCLTFALLSAVVLPGCTITRSKVLEELGVVSAVGYDLAENGGDLLGTTVLPNFTDTGQEKVDVLSVTGHTSKELRFNMSRMSERKLVSGQIRVVLYGEELSRTGILPLSDTLFRDAEIGSQIVLAVVEGRAINFFTKRYPDKPSIDIYLYRMLRKEMSERSMPKTNLHTFIRDVYDNGKDPVLPYLRLGKEDILVDGLAVFQEDKFIGLLNAKEARNLAYISSTGTSTGELEATLKETIRQGGHAHAVLMYIKTSTDWNVSQSGGRPVFQANVLIQGAVSEYTGEQNLEEKQEIQKLEKEFAKEYQQELSALIKKLQKDFGTDQLGLGEMYRAKGFIKDLEKEKWREMYKQAKIDVKVNVRILQTGMIH